MLLGCIGDDFTGSSDIANTLSKSGMRVTQYSGIPSRPATQHVEAGIVSLKTRTVPVADAISQSLDAADWLLEQGCQQLYFKYCSTFDSTKEGNIGPVTEALAGLVGEDKVVMCPAFPTAGRTIYQGHLFVGEQLLSESGMRNHPLTPMTDPDLKRWLSHQTSWAVNKLLQSDVSPGASHIAKALDAMPTGMVIVDAIDDKDLKQIGTACAARKLLTGGSGLAMGLPENFRRLGLIGDHSDDWLGNDGPAVILSGSCSLMTRAQVERYKAQAPSFALTAQMILEQEVGVDDVARWVLDQSTPPLVYTSADPDMVQDAQQKYGREKAANAIELFFGQLAISLVDQGVTRLVTAGGETSGAVVMSLGFEAMEIGPEIAAGVPAMRVPERELVIALKSGNFGQEDFFERALDVLGHA